MKILFLADNFPPEVNAAASRVHERAKYWVKWGHDVTVITCAPNFPLGKVYPGYKNKWFQSEFIDGIKVVRVKTFIAKNEGFLLRTLDFLSFMFMAVLRGSFLQKPDVVVATSPQFFTAVGGFLLSRIKRRPFVFEIGDLWPESIRAVGALQNERVYRAIEKLEIYLYKKAKCIIAQTVSFKDNLVSRGIGSDKIHVIMNGVDTDIYKPQEKSRCKMSAFNMTYSDFVVGYVGTHGMAHDLHTILKSAEILQSKNNIKFLFVGEGAAKKSLIEYQQKKNINNSRFSPAVEKKDMPDVWSVCDIIIIPLKNNKTFSTVVPSKLFEAMAMAKVIILMAPEGEASKIIYRHQCGLLTTPEDQNQLAESILYLYDNTSEMENLSKKALASSKLYTREKQALDMIKCLESIVDSSQVLVDSSRG